MMERVAGSAMNHGRSAEPRGELRASILIVDDHPANLLAIEAILEPLGQHVVEAGSGQEALKRLLEREFALILMDVQMPGLDGVQTARIIKERERTRHVPIIFLTAISRDPTNIFRGYSTGAVDYLLKPFEPEILRAKVQVFVDLWRRGKQLEQREAVLRQREREMLEAASEVRFREVTDSMPLCVLAGRADGAIEWCNRVWQEYTGQDLARTRTSGLRDVVHPDDRVALVEGNGAPLGLSDATELRLRRARDGAYRWFLCRAVRTSEAQGVAWIATLTDIDDQRRDREDLQRANDAKDAFIAAASHELRTPLAAAKAQAQLALRRLREQLETPPARSLRTITSQIDRMARLVEDLLDVSRVQHGRLSLDVARFDLCELMREAVERFEALSEQHHIELEVPAELELDGDRNRIDQVLTNLLANAVRYSPRGGRVLLRATSEEHGAHVVVRDFGVGIPAEKQALIFERFGRAHGAKYGGLGLGLTIAQGIVEQHGGEIWVESTGVPGEGSTFHVRLPRSPAAHA